MGDDQEYRKIGSVLKPHGVGGEFVVFLESDFPEWLARRECVWAAVAGEMAQWPIEGARLHQGKLLLKTSALDSREAVEEARGVALFVPEREARAVVADPDSFFNSDLVGMKVVNAVDQAVLGQVGAVIEMPAQNLLETVKPDGGSFLIPFVKPMIARVDEKAGVIEALLPEGLIDCNDPEP